MLKIRLQRIGKRGQAYFKVVVTEHTVKPQGKYLELLGSYDPHKNKFSADGNKIKDWLKKGAKMSGTLNNLLINRGVIEGDKVKIWKQKKKEVPATTTQEASVKPSPVKEAPPVEAKPEITPEEQITATTEVPAVTP
ncbi:MAG: 30S ribosomal protein S16 [Patescibacteria group bacterium]